MSASGTAVTIGTIIDKKYKVISLMGQGGMGEIFKVAHIQLGKTFALKVVKFQVSSPDVTKIIRFNREAKVLAKLQHPNIVIITDFGVIDNNVPYLVMEYIEGITLRELISNKKVIGYAEALDIAKQIAAGLYQAHVQGVVHRDLKPENIMIQQLPDGQIIARILDFGIAKLVAEEEEANISKDVLGTLKYMSYEQVMGEKVDLRTDIYSLCLMVFEMITGTTTSFMMDDAKAAHELVSNLPYQVSEIIHKGLSKHANKRQQTALELRREIEAFEQGLSVDELLEKNSKMTNLMAKNKGKNTGELSGAPTNTYKLISNTHEGKNTEIKALENKSSKNKSGENKSNESGNKKLNSSENNKTKIETTDAGKKSFGKYIAMFLGVLVIASLSIGVYHFAFNKKVGTEEVKNAASVIEPTLISISADTFTMGSNKGKDVYAKPEHIASVPVFQVAKKMVTNKEYAQFIKDTGYQVPPHWQGKNPPAFIMDKPITQVNWKEATDYCKWLSEKTGRSYRLISEKEWEYLARNRSKYETDVLTEFSEWTSSSLQAYPGANKDLAQKIEAANKDNNNKIKIFRGVDDESETDPVTFRLFQVDYFTKERLSFRVAHN